MNWKRFGRRLAIGICLVLVVAWGCRSPQQPETTAPHASPPVEAIAPEPDASEPQLSAPAPRLLPEATQAILANAGGAGKVFDPPRGDVRMVVVSDLNGIYGSTDYDPEVDKGMALIQFWNPDIVVCSGDMVAGQNPTLSDEQIRAMWQGFDEHVAAPLRNAGLPYGFTIGNHDASSALGVGGSFLFQRERDLASEYWLEPEHDPGIDFIDRFEFPFYYTFKSGDVFFLAWDGSSHRIPDEKLAWVELALASPEAQNAKLRVLLGHLPLYAVAVGRNEPAEVMANADELRAMLERYNVHTYISGHHHAYYPGHRGDLQLLHMGILGSGPRPLIDSNLPPWKALTVLDVNFEKPELTTYTTYDIRTLETIAYGQLPRFLAGHNGIVLRRDVEWTDLNAQEQAFCRDRLGDALCGP
ncbi:putative phosphohydrolase [Rubidibacter lacunae KORDI 51-2]|uniref:Putative phosphohydrolase n=1 Tax=Rubidibacter lacunae KORDI 51-2 TaxID=582515 RepID=U5DH78_9CHRO|nr:metallophosphoesterase [Rubidibacter lacunae]ERN40956.1 putative phosphohydrolase [Rubidibacter lacunae KORDI 51-2]